MRAEYAERPLQVIDDVHAPSAAELAAQAAVKELEARRARERVEAEARAKQQRREARRTEREQRRKAAEAEKTKRVEARAKAKASKEDGEVEDASGSDMDLDAMIDEMIAYD